jgi:polysaccharide deacetylase family protein (PEP-CTERM system associated)
MDPAAFREELQQGKRLLEDLTGQKVEAFRAPSFSITKKSLWALDVLADEGFRYDSSIFPIYHDRYGIPDAPREIHSIETQNGTLWEFPPSAAAFCKMNLPVSGGGYFRLYPYALTRHFLRRINKKEGRPFIFYVHPWEVDPEQPVLPFGSRATQFRHRVGLGRNLAKLRKLLRDFQFCTLSEAIQVEKEKTGNFK